MFEIHLSTVRSAIAATIVAVAATLQPLQPAVASPLGFGSGVKLVGIDIQPGTYRSLNPGRSCYWERLSGVGGTFGEILANDNVTGQAVVTIAPGDFAFSSVALWRLERRAQRDVRQLPHQPRARRIAPRAEPVCIQRG